MHPAIAQRNTRASILLLVIGLSAALLGLQQVVKAFEADLNQLAISARDYAAWDDAYVFAANCRATNARLRLCSSCAASVSRCRWTISARAIRACVPQEPADRLPEGVETLPQLRRLRALIPKSA